MADLAIRDTAGMALALAIGVASGALASLAGMPLPWLLGPMLGNTAMALLRLPVRGPSRLRPLVIPIIGVMLGSGFTPDILGAIGNWAATLLLLPIYIVVAATVSYQIYHRIAGYDRATAFFSAMPGGLNEMMLMGAAAGGSEHRIALAHATRILIVVSFVAGFFSLALGVDAARAVRPTVTFGGLGAAEFAILLAAAVLGSWAGKRARLPAAGLLGPMALSAAVHLAGWVHSAPPDVLMLVAQVVIGTVIGCRFAGTAPRLIVADVGLGALSSLAMILVALGFAAALSSWTGADLSTSFLAFSPGGLTEMSLLALAMGQDVAYVTVAHTARIAYVVFGTPLAARIGRLRPVPETPVSSKPDAG